MNREQLLRELLRLARAGGDVAEYLETQLSEPYKLVRLATGPRQAHTLAKSRIVQTVSTNGGEAKIYHHKGVYYAVVSDLQGLGVASDTLQHCIDQVRAAMREHAEIEWKPLLRVMVSGRARQTKEHRQGQLGGLDDRPMSMMEADVSISVDRYWLGVRMDGSKVWAEWGDEPGPTVRGKTGGKRVAVDEGLHEDRFGHGFNRSGKPKYHVVPYDEAIWLQLEKLYHGIDDLRKRISDVLMSGDGMAKLAAGGQKLLDAGVSIGD